MCPSGVTTTRGFNGARGSCPPFELGLIEFQERPYVACGIQESLLAARAPSRNLLGELAMLP